MSSSVHMVINRLYVWKYVIRNNHFALFRSELIRDLFNGRCLKVMTFESQKDLKCQKHFQRFRNVKDSKPKLKRNR